MARRIFRRLLIASALFAALIAATASALFLFRAPLASALAPRLLARLGFPETGLAVRAIEKDRIALAEASGALALEAGVLRLRLEDAACVFDFRELLTGRIRRLEVGRAEVDFSGQPDGDSPGWPPERIARLLRELPGIAAGYTDKMPLRELRIDELVLRLRLSGRAWAPPPLALHYGHADGRPALRLTQPGGEATPLAAELALDQDGAVLRGTLAADLSALTWLPEGFAPPLRGQARAEARLAGDNMQLSAQAEHLAGADGTPLAEWGAEQVKLAAGLGFAESGEVALSTDSRLDIAGLAGPDIALTSAAVPLAGALRFGESGLSLDWLAGDALRLAKARFGDWRLDELKATQLSFSFTREAAHQASLSEGGGPKGRREPAGAGGAPPASLALGSPLWEGAFEGGNRAGESALAFAPGSRLDITNLTGPNVALTSAALPLSGTLRFGEFGLSLDWQAGKALRLTSLRLADLRIADIAAADLSAKATYGAGQGGRLTVGDKARIDIRKLEAPGVTFARLQGPIPLQGELGATAQSLKWQPKSPVAVESLVTGPVAFQPVNFRDLRLSFARNTKGMNLALDSRIPELGGPLRLTWSAPSGNPEQRLTVSAPKKLQLAPEASPLNVLRGLPAIMNNIAIEQGRLGAELRFTWGKSPFAASMDAELADGALTWKGVGTMSGIELKKTRLDFAPRLTMPRPAELAVKTVDCVVPLRDIAVRAQLQSGKKGAPALVLHEARVGVAEGQARAKNCRFEFGDVVNRCDVTLHGLDLAAMHSLRAFEGLEVGGRIDGFLPVRTGPKGGGVARGSLTNAGPGVIRYTPSNEALKGSPYSEMVLKALEDYRYDKLAADVDYRPSGALRIGLRLEGKSPALKTERPVHLNIDSEQNLLSLLKSLQYSQGLTSELNRKVQERYQGKGSK